MFGLLWLWLVFFLEKTEFFFVLFSDMTDKFHAQNYDFVTKERIKYEKNRWNSQHESSAGTDAAPTRIVLKHGK